MGPDLLVTSFILSHIAEKIYLAFLNPCITDIKLCRSLFLTLSDSLVFAPVKTDVPFQITTERKSYSYIRLSCRKQSLKEQVENIRAQHKNELYIAISSTTPKHYSR